MKKTLYRHLKILSLLIGALFLFNACSSTDLKSSETHSEEVLGTTNHAAYATGTIKPSNLTQEQLDEELLDFYKRWRKKYLTTVPGVYPSQKYVNWKTPWTYPENAVTVSEAHGYGMIILAKMGDVTENAQEDFDALYRFFKAHPSKFNENFMAWRPYEDENGEIVSPNMSSAVDGDMDIAYSLIAADNQWGSDGEINYREEGIKIIQAIMENQINQEDWIIQVGDWVQGYYALEGDNYDKSYLTLTRPSDYMIQHIYTFSKVDEKYSKEWMKVYDNIIEISKYNYENWTPNTGLMADFLQKYDDGKYIPAIGTVLETEIDGDYGYNSCRVPFRLALNYLLLGDDSLNDQLNTLNRWISKETNGNPLNINPGYYVRNGENEGDKIIRSWDGTDMSFIAPFAVSAMINAEHQEWLDTLWDVMTAEEWGRGLPFEEIYYYPNTIRILSMIVVSGNWWLPN